MCAFISFFQGFLREQIKSSDSKWIVKKKYTCSHYKKRPKTVTPINKF